MALQRGEPSFVKNAGIRLQVEMRDYKLRIQKAQEDGDPLKAQYLQMKFNQKFQPFLQSPIAVDNAIQQLQDARMKFAIEEEAKDQVHRRQTEIADRAWRNEVNLQFDLLHQNPPGARPTFGGPLAPVPWFQRGNVVVPRAFQYGQRMQQRGQPNAPPPWLVPYVPGGALPAAAPPGGVVRNAARAVGNALANAGAAVAAAPGAVGNAVANVGRRVAAAPAAAANAVNAYLQPAGVRAGLRHTAIALGHTGAAAANLALAAARGSVAAAPYVANATVAATRGILAAPGYLRRGFNWVRGAPVVPAAARV